MCTFGCFANKKYLYKNSCLEHTWNENEAIGLDVQTYMQSSLVVENFQMKFESLDEAKDSTCYPSDGNKLVKKECSFDAKHDPEFITNGETIVIKPECYQVGEEIC